MNAPAALVTTAPAPSSRRPGASWLQRHPLLAFAGTAVGLTWAVQMTFLALGWPLFPALAIELLILLVTATTVTGLTEGRDGVRRLYAGVRRWRFAGRWYAVVLAMIPVATLAVAAVAGTLQGPSSGWAMEALMYLFLTLVFGALLGNMWEELAWTGFLQTRLSERHGLLRGALITALPFGLIHLPLAFEEHGLTGTPAKDVFLTWALLLGVAPFFRYLIGLIHDRTGRSLLAVAVLHGSFNASSSLSLTTGGWEYFVGTVIATPLVAVALRGRLGARR